MDRIVFMHWIIVFYSFLSPLVRACLSITQNRLRVWKQFMSFGDKLFHKVNGKSFMHVNGIAQKDTIDIIYARDGHPNQHRRQKRIRQISMLATMFYPVRLPLLHFLLFCQLFKWFFKRTRNFIEQQIKRTSSLLALFLPHSNCIQSFIFLFRIYIVRSIP